MLVLFEDETHITTLVISNVKLEADLFKEIRQGMLEIQVGVHIKVELLAGRVLHICNNLNGELFITKAELVQLLRTVLVHNTLPGEQLLDELGKRLIEPVPGFTNGKMPLTEIIDGIHDDTIILILEKGMKTLFKIGAKRSDISSKFHSYLYFSLQR